MKKKNRRRVIPPEGYGPAWKPAPVKKFKFAPARPQKGLPFRPLKQRPRAPGTAKRAQRLYPNAPAIPRRQRPARQGRPGRTQPLAPPPGPPDQSELEAFLALKYGDQERELDSQGRISDLQVQRTKDFYRDYLTQIAGANQATTAAYSNAQAGVYGQTNTAASQDQARMAEVQQAAEASAAIRGTAPAAPVDATQAIGARQALGGLFGGLIGAQGGAAAIEGAGRIMGGLGGEWGAVQEEHGRRREIDRDRLALAGDRGSDAVLFAAEKRKEAEEAKAAKAEAKREAKDAKFKRQTLLATLGLNTRKQTAAERKSERDRRQRERGQKRTAKNTRRGQNVTKRGQNVTKRGQRVTLRGQDVSAETQRRGQDLTRQTAIENRQAGKDGGGSKKYTQTQKNDRQAAFRRAKSISLKGIPKKDWIEYVSDTRSIDPLIVRAAILPSSLTAKQRAELRRMGIKVGGKKKGKAPSIGEAQDRIGQIFDGL